MRLGWTILTMVIFITGVTGLAQVRAQSGMLDSMEAQLSPVDDSEDFDRIIDFFMAVEMAQIKEGFKYPFRYLDYCHMAMDWADSEGGSEEIFKAKGLLLMFYSNHLNDEKVIQIGESLSYSEEFFNLGMAPYLLRCLARAYRRTGRYEDYLETIDQSYLLLSEYEGNSDEIEWFYFNLQDKQFSYLTGLGNIYYLLANYEKAAEIFKVEVEQNINEINPYGLSSRYNNIGLCYQKINLVDSAVFYFDLALETYNRHLDQKGEQNSKRVGHFKNVILANKAVFMMQDGKPEKALPYFQRELASSKAIREVGTILTAYVKLAEAYYKMGEPEISLRYCDSTLMMLDTIEDLSTKKRVTLVRAKALAVSGQKAEADRVFDNYTSLSDSIANNLARRRYMLATVEFETSRKERELTKNRQLYELEQSRNRLQRIGLFVLAGLLLITFVFLRILQRNAATIRTQKKEVDRSLKEKETLLKEVHHRVKNNLQIVSSLLVLQSGKINNPDFDELVRDTQRHVNSMALVHQLLYQENEFAMISMHEYMTQLGHQVLNGMGNHSDLNVHCKGVVLSIQKAIPLGLITSELITNSVKHAFQEDEGLIEIDMRQDNEGLVHFEYQDNGIGLPESIVAHESVAGSLGLRLMRMLAEEIDAEMSIFNENGARFQLIFIDKKQSL